MSPELWNRIPPEAQVIFLEMAQTIKRLEQRVEELERRLGMTPKNSSLPPSSQHPHAKPAPAKPKSQRKRGGQPGHEKFERALVPPERVDETIPLKPESCRRCGRRLKGRDTDPLRHQVWELPEIQPIITEYQRHRLTCDGCGATTCARLPAGVPPGQTGPRLVAFVALLMAYFRQSKRRVSEFCEMALHTPCSPGLVVKLQNQAAAALRPAYDEAARALPNETFQNIDESPTKEANHKAWLWTFVTKRFTLFAVRPTRGGDILDELLTDRFRGVVTCDRAKMYWRLPTLQWCWAHLQRDFQALVDGGVQVAKVLGKQLLEQTRLLFRQWSRCRDGTLSRAGLKTSLSKMRREVERLLLRGLNSRHAKTSGMCQELLQNRERLWAFLAHEGVAPTNNAAERALRHAVIWRKLSFGTQSAAGSRFVETLLTVIETCRQQQRDLLAFVTQSVERHFAHRRAPSLLARA
ncbi:MAG: IS66 family transposase [Planctomycetaceae bacterium]